MSALSRHGWGNSLFKIQCSITIIFQVDGPSGNSITYAQLKHSVKCVASGLTRLGLKKGQVLCIVGQNSVEWVQCFLGVLSTGAIVTAVNPAYTAGRYYVMAEL